VGFIKLQTSGAHGWAIPPVAARDGRVCIFIKPTMENPKESVRTLDNQTILSIQKSKNDFYPLHEV
jgi:hypothetical protein